MAQDAVLQTALGGASDALVTMRHDYYGLLGDTHLYLQQLIDQVELDFSWMSMSEDNEREFIRTIHQDLDPILTALAEDSNFESHFGHVMDALHRGKHKHSDAIELF